MAWKKEKHSKAFDLLPAKYQSDAKCLKCHTTGYGEETGWKSTDDTALAGITCESCHGPGSKHEEIAKPFAKLSLVLGEYIEIPPDLNEEGIEKWRKIVEERLLAITED